MPSKKQMWVCSEFQLLEKVKKINKCRHSYQSPFSSAHIPFSMKHTEVSQAVSMLIKKKMFWSSFLVDGGKMRV